MNITLSQTYNLIYPDWKIKNESLEEILSQSPYTLFFVYPKNDTPGCTLENTDFSNHQEEFTKKWIQCIGISRDNLDSHNDFISKYCLKNILLSDLDLFLHKELGAFWEKNNYGKKVEWVIRSTFLFDREGNLIKEWKNVKATGHVEKLLREINL